MVNARKHTTPSGSDTSVSRATIFETFGNSIHDIIPVANATERSLLVSGLVAAGTGPSSTNPVYVHRADAGGANRIEWTVDGSVWVSLGVLPFASKAAADSWAVANGALLAVGDRANAGGVLLEWSGAMWVFSGPSLPHFGFAKTGSFLWQTTETDHTWNPGVSEGALAGFSTGDFITFTCTTPGMYLIVVQLTANTGTGPLTMSFMRNGAAYRIVDGAADAVSYVGLSLTVSRRFAVGDTFKTRIRGGGGPIAGVATAAQSFMTVDMLHA